MTTYRVQSVNGQFDHVATKKAAMTRAVEMTGATPGTSETDLRKHYGVTLSRVTPAVARSVGF